MEQPIIIQQQMNPWWTVAAILATLLSGAIGAVVGSVVTLRKQKHINDENNARERKMNIFRVLMATRGHYLRFRLEHVGVLNTIPVEFDRDESVLEAWNRYLSELRSKETNLEELMRRRDEAFFDLVFQISKAVRYNHNREYIKNSTYVPDGYGEEMEDWFKVRKWATEIAEGKKPLPVWIYDDTKFPTESKSVKAGTP